jgi:hypothetical protein
MIIAIAFFSLAAAICTSLFVRAHVISDGTRDANMAVLAAQSVAECFKANGGSAEATAAYFQTEANSNGEVYIYLDNAWSVVPKAQWEADHVVYVKVDESTALKRAMIAVIDTKTAGDNGGIAVATYTLDVAQYNDGEGGA